MSILCIAIKHPLTRCLPEFQVVNELPDIIHKIVYIHFLLGKRSIRDLKGFLIPKIKTTLLGRIINYSSCLRTIQQQRTYLKFLLELLDFHNFQVTLLIQNFQLSLLSLFSESDILKSARDLLMFAILQEECTNI